MSFIKAIWAVFGFNPDEEQVIESVVVDGEIEAVIDAIDEELGEEE